MLLAVQTPCLTNRCCVDKLQVIARMGKWLYQSIYNSYLRYFKPEGLLGLAGWPRAAQKDYTTFFHPRFCMPVPTELQQLLMPFLGCLEKEVQGMGKAATASRRAFLKLLRYGAGVVVQDALELVDLAPRNPVHQLLLRHPCFRWGPNSASKHVLVHCSLCKVAVSPASAERQPGVAKASLCITRICKTMQWQQQATVCVLLVWMQSHARRVQAAQGCWGV